MTVTVCEDLQDPDFGSVSVDDIGLVATYQCNIPYTLNGTSTRNCSLDGTSWNLQQPVCGKTWSHI